MSPTTTARVTQYRRKRRVAAVVLVGMGLASLGVASASTLNVTAKGDLVASGVDAEVTGFLSDKAKAYVEIYYPDVDDQEEGEALADVDTLLPKVRLTITDAHNVPESTELQVYFYQTGADGTEIIVAQAEVEEVTEAGTTFDLTLADSNSNALIELPTFDRVAVVAISPEYTRGPVSPE
ncbi:hypothetical protein [Xylanimonas ulmi]|uniref:Ribosomally synthesized peptide with SipW-like signal peptide n=1 Tax=Xylanimonas ulmi TaxID=228973 RepID=A0A4Q7M4S0_9MICO|nr:hypothetical protein [Xylanibacterium ulmi]RZS62013.1 hypothetical protein EV386_2330 [Xylanibacterium ulmi]